MEESLKNSLDKKEVYLRTRQKTNYALAKSLGFSAKEAGVLQNWREQRIRDLAKQRGYTGGGE